MSDKTIEQLLEEQNELLVEQNKLLRRGNAQARGAADSQYIEELRARARRDTPWGCKPPSWAR